MYEKQRGKISWALWTKMGKIWATWKYTLSSAGAYSLRRRIPNAIRPLSQNCYNNSRPITLEIFEPYGYVPPQSVGFLRRFGMKMGIDFAHYGLESDVVYEGTTVVYQCVRRFNSKWIREKVKFMRIRNGF